MQRVVILSPSKGEGRTTNIGIMPSHIWHVKGRVEEGQQVEQIDAKPEVGAEGS